jgi:hypothetical protein
VNLAVGSPPTIVRALCVGTVHNCVAFKRRNRATTVLERTAHDEQRALEEHDCVHTHAPPDGRQSPERSRDPLHIGIQWQVAFAPPWPSGFAARRLSRRCCLSRTLFPKALYEFYHCYGADCKLDRLKEPPRKAHPFNSPGLPRALSLRLEEAGQPLAQAFGGVALF